MSPAPNGIYNIGTGKATSFEDIADAFHEKYQRSEEAIPKKILQIPMPVKFKKHYQYYTCADLTKLKKHIINPDFAFQDPIDYVVESGWSMSPEYYLYLLVAFIVISWILIVLNRYYI